MKFRQADDRRRSETADVKLAGDLQRLESKIDGGLDRLEAKIDGVITNIGERKADTNERWKISGIIVSTVIAILALIKSFFFS